MNHIYVKKYFQTGILLLCVALSAMAQEVPLQVLINPAKTYQTIEHFGASDAWACQFVGNWPVAKKNAIAELLFSQNNNKKGQPQGIGLSLWRFNIGAGSAEKGKESGIKDEWRRAESFMNEDGSYNWQKQAGQLWFLEAAKKHKVDRFLAFTNSPPVQFTSNQKAFATAGKPNLAPEQYPNFARFLTEVIRGVKNKTGITFDFISPVNEPQWDWSDGGQEGTPFDNQHIADITKHLSVELQKAQLPTQISIAEAGQLDYLLNPFNKPARGNQIQAFFQADSPWYLGNLPNLSKNIGGHSYFTTSPYADAAQKRVALAREVAKIQGLRYWMTEYCILGDNAGEIEGNGKDTGINAALYVAKTIHNDLVNGQATAWHWWTAISAYQYKDGLIYVDKNKTDGVFEDSKILWALGNFSRFIRPGAERISIEMKSESPYLVSAYKDSQRKQIIVVCINSTNEKSKFQFSGFKTNKKAMGYTTSESEKLSPSVVKNTTVELPARSVTTLVYRMK